MVKILKKLKVVKMFAIAKEVLKENERIFFCVTEQDVQEVAKRVVGRELTEDELYRASKGIEAGLSEGLWIVIETAIKDAIEGV